MNIINDLRYNGAMDANHALTEIGYISACIAGDHRYSSYLRVYVEGIKAHVVLTENGAVGGMDGPGGATPFRETQRTTVDATPRDIMKAVKATMDDTIKRYGKPTKRFVWVGIDGRGLNQGLVAQALSAARE